MNNLKNSVRLIGNLGGDPEIKKFDKGNKCAKFTIATNERYTDKEGNKVTDTQWHNIIAWGKNVDVIENHCVKGTEVAIEGKLTTRTYDKDGEKKYFTEIVLNDFIMLGKKSSN